MNKHMIALGLVLASSIALAQPGDGPKAGGKAQRLATMQQELGLTDEQVAKMREIREAGGSRKDLQAVLTPEQRARAAELKKGQPGKGMNRMKEHLGLSDEQVAQIQAIRKEGGSREQIRAILTPEQQAKFDQARNKQAGQAPQTEE